MQRFAKYVLLAAFAVFSLAAGASNAFAQAPASCLDIQKILDQRRTLVAQLNSASAKTKQLDAKVACGVFTKLAANGATASKWFEENKAWCQVPDEFVEGFQKDHAQVGKLRAQACKVAAQIEAAQKKAQESSGNPAWGGGISGQYQMPKGAL